MILASTLTTLIGFADIDARERVVNAKSAAELMRIMKGAPLDTESAKRNYLVADMLLDSTIKSGIPRRDEFFKKAQKISDEENVDPGLNALSYWWFMSVDNPRVLPSRRDTDIVQYGIQRLPGGGTRKFPIYSSRRELEKGDRYFEIIRRYEANKLRNEYVLMMFWWAKNNSPRVSDGDIVRLTKSKDPIVRVSAISEMAHREKWAGRKGPFRGLWAEVAQNRKGSIFVDILNDRLR